MKTRRRKRVTVLRAKRNPLSVESCVELCRDGITVRATRDMTRKNPGGVRIVYNRLLGGWYVVKGPHQTPLNGRFDTKADAQAWLQRKLGRKNPGVFRRALSGAKAGVYAGLSAAAARRRDAHAERALKNPRRRSRRNPPLVTFANPPRGGKYLSHNVTEIRYQHAEDGNFYKHDFRRNQVCIIGKDGAKTCTLVRKDGKPILSEY